MSDFGIADFDMRDILRPPTLLLALGMLIAGCATSPEQQAQRDSERCASRGHQPNTKAHDDCVTNLVSQRDARMNARHRELVERPAATPFGR